MAKKQVRFATLCVLLLFLVALPGCAGPIPPATVESGTGSVSVHFIDVGQGDSILIQSPEGASALIDGGEANGQALAYLQTLGIKQLDSMILSHPHSDHVGGLLEVLRQLPVRQVWTSGASATTRVFEDFIDTITAQKIPYHETKRGDQIAVGSLTLEVVYSHSEADNLNDTSMVLRMVSGRVAFLFTGDAEAKAEQEMLGNNGGSLQATVLKVGHHGSQSSSTVAFLRAVRPQIAIYSAALHNDYGHPDASTIANLKAAGAAVYGTAVHGTIVVQTDGAGIQIHPMNNRPTVAVFGNRPEAF